jgi:hypothetical protein
MIVMAGATAAAFLKFIFSNPYKQIKYLRRAEDVRGVMYDFGMKPKSMKLAPCALSLILLTFPYF